MPHPYEHDLEEFKIETSEEFDQRRFIEMPAVVPRENASLYALLADIRQACGDNGKRMQDELVQYIADLHAKAGECDALKAQVDALREQLEYMAQQHRCGCNHPYCNRCADDNAIEMAG